MTTLTLQLDEKLVDKARAIAWRKQSSVDAVIAEALENLGTASDPADGFLSLVQDMTAKGFTMPTMSREERNARE